MYTIVVASQKGGSGKTTLSGHLAVQACRAGVGPVCLIDTDPQGSLAQWWNARAADEPHFVKAGVLNLKAALAELAAANVRIAVIDTPPAITQSIAQVVAHADMVIVPTRPSPHDLRAVGATVDIAERHRKPLIFVVNAANPRARITGESAVALSQHGTVAPVIVHHRVDFAASMIDGRTVGEIAPDSASAREIDSLWTYIQDKLSRIVQDPKLIPEVKPAEFAVGALTPVAEEEAAPIAPAPPAPATASSAAPALPAAIAPVVPPAAEMAQPEPPRQTVDEPSPVEAPVAAIPVPSTSDRPLLHDTNRIKVRDRRVHVFGRRTA